MSNSILKGKKVDCVPGLNLMALVNPAVSSLGEFFPTGTEYHPVSFGYNNALRREYQKVAINGTEVTFLGPKSR